MITQRWNAFTDWFNRREYSENAVLLGFAIAIGVLTALGVIAFYRTIDLAYAVFYRWPAPWLPPAVGLLYRPVVTGAGFALAWWVMRRFARGNDGLNVPDVQLAVVRRGGSIPGAPRGRPNGRQRHHHRQRRAPPGSEGPGRRPRARPSARCSDARFASRRNGPRRSSGCASAAAISAAFNAPLAGAFFAIEEILGSFSVASFSPVVVASVVAAVVSRAVFGNHPAFPMPPHTDTARSERS